MLPNRKTRFPRILWISILIFLIVLITFPRWIGFFYPQPHRDLVLSAAYENNIDPYLVFAVIRAESKYQTGAQSSAGARGLMQIMPDTAKWIAEQQGIEDITPEKLHEPETNIRLGCWYLASLNKEFEGRMPLVIAAYNAGRGKTREWVIEQKWGGDPEKIDNIPYEETRLYVKNVLANYRAYRAIYASR